MGRKVIRISDEEWEKWKQKRGLSYNKMSRVLFPYGLELPRRQAKSKEVYVLEDEANPDTWQV